LSHKKGLLHRKSYSQLGNLYAFDSASLPRLFLCSTPKAKAFVVLDYAASMVFVSCCDEHGAVIVEGYFPSDFW
tara:strand:+ start:12293 stop:12514 length:222 start_codon:yes stop_codon:yes gene_type:complete